MATEDTKIKESTLTTPTGVVSPSQITPTVQQQATITPQKEAMDASKIGTVPKLKLPPAVAPTASSGLDEYIAVLTKTTKDNANQEREDSMKREEAALKQSQSDIGILTESIAGAEARKARLYEKEGINDIRKQVDEYTSQIEAEQLATRRKIDSLQKSGMTAEAAQGEANRIQRESTAKQADLAILQNAALRKYDTLSEIADRKIQAELEPMKARLDNLKFFYGENKDVLTKKQDQVYQEKIKTEEREYNRQEQEKKDTQAVLLEVAKNGAPATVLQSIMSAKTPSDAIQIAGTYLTSPMEKLQMQKISQDITKGGLDIAKLSAELAMAKQTLGGSTGDPITDIIAGSNRYGDNSMSDGTTSDLSQAFITLGNVQELQKLIAGENTGIISGNVKSLMGKLSSRYANADAINKQIQRTVPGLARGIFKEVGVLTDADIANYKKTLPNLTSPEAQNKLAVLMTLDIIERSIGTVLTTQAKNQKNVSGFVQDYNSMKQQANALRAELGIAQEEAPVDPVLSTSLDNALSSRTGLGGVASTVSNQFANLEGSFERR